MESKTVIKGITLDPDMSYSDEASWYLYFTEGLFQYPGAVRQTEPFVIDLFHEDFSHCADLPCLYEVYFNPKTNVYSLVDVNNKTEECRQGYLIGGFQARGCDLLFLHPKDCDDVEYVRGFTPRFDESVNKTLECDDCLGDFNINEFSDSFDKECAIINGPEIPGSGENSPFRTVSFSEGFQV